MKKFILWFVTLSLIFSICCIPAFAATTESTEIPQSTVEPRAEEVEWYTRVYNGKLQKRLWSITYQVWLTDWIDVE